MALHSVDKNSADRSNPSPNTHDKIADQVGRMAHNTQSTQFIPPGVQNLDGLGNPNVASLGQFVKTGVIICDYTSTPLQQAFAVPHGLNYAPFPVGALTNANLTAISNGGTSTYPLPGFLSGTVTGGTFAIDQWIFMVADTTNVYCYLINASAGTGAFLVTYYLYKQPAQQ